MSLWGMIAQQLACDAPEKVASAPCSTTVGEAYDGSKKALPAAFSAASDRG
jgi:hypothetical protein